MPSLTQPKPEVVSASRAKTMCRECLAWREERLDLKRQADALEKQEKGHKAELIAFVDASKSGKAREVQLGKFRLSVTQKKKQFNALAALVKQIGQAAVEKLKRASKATYDVLEIDTK